MVQRELEGTKMAARVLSHRAAPIFDALTL